MSIHSDLEQPYHDARIAAYNMLEPYVEKRLTKGHILVLGVGWGWVVFRPDGTSFSESDYPPAPNFKQLREVIKTFDDTYGVANERITREK
jgi:hypothetical protein